jgi:uncharacterized repeat protein (TIGR03803 family)
MTKYGGLFMRNMKVSIGMMAALAVIMVTLFMTSNPAAAQTETVIYTFDISPHGAGPLAGLTFDGSGNLYGTTPGGGFGNFSDGTAFELTPSSGGSMWTPSLLETYGISSGHPNGGLIFDGAGNLYGATAGGGAHGGGVVFELVPQAGGGWTEKWLHQFGQGTDGINPVGNLVFDSAGNLYGTTVQGGTYGEGTVFELIPQAGGLWTEKVLHNFSNTGPDGAEPEAGVILDAAGNLYGTTLFGGTNRSRGGYVGVVYELSPAGSEWNETILYSFAQSRYDAAGPYGSLIFDATGNLYGTTTSGGRYFGDGTVFELSPHSRGPWTETVLHSFSDAGKDGYHPYCSLIFDSAGNLYGTTSQGGAYGQGGSFLGGTVFELMPASGGNWTERIVHSFGNGTDGSEPLDGLIFDASGNLYGTTEYGGGGVGDGPGTVFEISR